MTPFDSNSPADSDSPDVDRSSIDTGSPQPSPAPAGTARARVVSLEKSDGSLPAQEQAASAQPAPSPFQKKSAAPDVTDQEAPPKEKEGAAPGSRKESKAADSSRKKTAVTGGRGSKAPRQESAAEDSAADQDSDKGSREGQRARQRAYRERLKERGLHELRLRVPRENQEDVRQLVGRFMDEDPLLSVVLANEPRSSRVAWLPSWFPITRGQWRFFGAAAGFFAVIGGLFTAFLLTAFDLNRLQEATSQVPTLEKEILALEQQRDSLEAEAEAARAEAVRAIANQTALKTALLSLNDEVRELRYGLLAGGGFTGNNTRQPTPPGPRLVPRAGEGNPAPKGAEPPTSLQAHLAVYTFRSGDTLESVAQRYGVSLKAILEANRRLRPEPWRYGDRIVIPLQP